VAVTPDVAKALANYQWRHQPLAGPHDPRDRSTASLPRVLAAAAFAQADPSGAVRLAGECPRATHQSPLVIEACRYLGALLVGALRGAAPEELAHGLYEPEPGVWTERPLKPAVAAAFRSRSGPDAEAVQQQPRADVIQAVLRARDAAMSGLAFDETVRAAAAHAAEPALEAALAGALYGAMHGERSVAGAAVSRLARRELLESFASRLAQAGSVARRREPKG
jgi:ADP-ribosylglycohydrolase